MGLIYLTYLINTKPDSVILKETFSSKNDSIVFKDFGKKQALPSKAFSKSASASKSVASKSKSAASKSKSKSASLSKSKKLVTKK